MDALNPYHLEQLESLAAIRHYLETAGPAMRRELAGRCADYLAFRKDADAFQARHFADICTARCFADGRSACCSREGIIAFFADMLVNVLLSSPGALDDLRRVLERPNRGDRCVYLVESGCLWTIKPIVCQMFLCDAALAASAAADPSAPAEWESLCRRRKRFTWPDRPVLFDDLEAHFIGAGVRTTLMYCHNSPGLLAVKRKAVEKQLKLDPS